MTEIESNPNEQGNLSEVALVFLRLGLTAFGGPAAHIAMMRGEFVDRLKWLTDAEFADLLGASNLVPGPTSTELAIHIGYRRAGVLGLLLAGICFILPAALIVLAIAIAYVQYGGLPDAHAALKGVKPVILAIVAQALIGLGRSVLKDWKMLALAGLAVGASLLGVNELLVVFTPGLLLGLNSWRTKPSFRGILPLLGATVAVGLFFVLNWAIDRHSAGLSAVTPGSLFLEFFKLGAVLYGSGYVLLSYLETDVVKHLAWLSPARLLDAVAVGQFTPGPVFTTATFVGYVLGGFTGAAAATFGIFLPAFIFVYISARSLPKLRNSPTMSAFLTGVNAASLGLIAAVLLKLGTDAITNIPSALIATVALAVLMKTKLNSAWLVLAGAIIGLVFGGKI